MAACLNDAAAGRTVYLLVPERALHDALPLAPPKVQVRAIEAFIGQMLDEMSGFEQAAARELLGALVACCNAQAAEADAPLPPIEAPEGLRR